MLQDVFIGLSLLGAEWVLYLLVVLSVTSIGLIFERAFFYKRAQHQSDAFRQSLEKTLQSQNWESDLEKLKTLSLERMSRNSGLSPDFDSPLALALIDHYQKHPDSRSIESLNEIAQSPVLNTKTKWEKYLTILATIGSNAPFIGLFGTVLGIIQAFRDLSENAGTGVQTVTAGISEALVATAVGLFVAIPAVVAFNLFQRRVKRALTEAESLKSLFIGKMCQG